MGKKVSLLHTFMFLNICVFFSFVALHWEVKHRRRFRRMIPVKRLSVPEIESAIADFSLFKSCSDPYIENFVNRHPVFSPINRLWLLNSSRYWLSRCRRELRRRGAS